MSLLGFTTTAFLIAVIASETIGLSKLWTRVAWVGLVLAGIPWLCGYATEMTRIPGLVWLTPVFYGVIGGIWLRKLMRSRQQEEKDLQEAGGWRCPACKTPNAAVNAVCYDCGGAKPKAAS